MMIGMFLSLVLCLSEPLTFHFILFGVYGLLFLFQIKVMPKRIRPWGVVFDSRTYQPVELAVITLFSAGSNKKCKCRLTDYYGRFYFLAPKGNYKLKVSKSGYRYPSQVKKKRFRLGKKNYKHPYYGQKVNLKKDQAFISVNIPMDKK